MNCPCGSSKNLDQCCGPIHQDATAARTPEQLMRARYTAFALKNMDFIAHTIDPQTRDQFDLEENRKWAQDCEFIRLEVLSSSENGNKGMVEFKVTYREGDKETLHHERSHFRKQQGQWYFRKGQVLP